MNKQFWKAALIRALRTVAQVLGASMFVDTPITVAMVKGLDINALWGVVAWLATGILSGVASILMSIATGLPEVPIASEKKSADDNEESCPVKVVAYDDYYADGTPKLKNGNFLPPFIKEDGEENDSN